MSCLAKILQNIRSRELNYEHDKKGRKFKNNKYFSFLGHKNSSLLRACPTLIFIKKKLRLFSLEKC